MFLVKCPKCMHEMKTDAKEKKKCVYCGHTFSLFTKKGNRIQKKI
jgi:rRNA maturation endonuclease Nob1